MELYLMRHGIAEDSEAGLPDSQRSLTAEGREKTAGVLRIAKRAGLKPGVILSSPYVRAMQTAKIAADVLEFPDDIVKCNSLVPHSSPEDIWRELREYADANSLLLTSHEPILGQTIAYLLNSPALRVDVRKASVTRIDFTEVRGMPRGTLQWMITPKFS